MTILYLSYWGLNDPLTVSTVYPHLEILDTLESIEKIVFVTIERSEAVPSGHPFNCQKVVHYALHSKNYRHNIFNKTADFFHFPIKLQSILDQYRVSYIFTRGVMAGALAYSICRRNKLKLCVESFEPHADYMRETGEWPHWGLRYRFQKYWEKKQMQYASILMPVSENYKLELIRQGISPNKIFTIPCCVPVEVFSYSETQRSAIRKELSIADDSIVGIYTGKFGGIYYDEEAFWVFKQAFAFFKDRFRLIILSPHPRTLILASLHSLGMDTDKIVTGFVAHDKIPAYLSASDMAFTLTKPNPYAKFSSHIKIGEYWANGLPVVCPPDCGDDSNIIITKNAGAVFELTEESLASGFAKISVILKDQSHRNEISRLAYQYRSFERTRGVYSKIFTTK